MPKHFATALLLFACMFSGCESFWEHKASSDIYTYRSSPILPTTITLVDVTTHKTFWTMDIPVSHELKLDFDRQKENEVVNISRKPATHLKWRLIKDRTHKVVDSGEGDLQGYQNFIIKVSYRDTPEFAPDDGKATIIVGEDGKARDIVRKDGKAVAAASKGDASAKAVSENGNKTATTASKGAASAKAVSENGNKTAATASEGAASAKAVSKNTQTASYHYCTIHPRNAKNAKNAKYIQPTAINEVPKQK